MSSQAPMHVDPKIVESSSDEMDQKLVIRKIGEDLVTFSAPFTRGGLSIGGRSTAIRLPLPSSPIFIYASTPLTPATKQTIAAMGGEVGWIVTPDGEHGMFTSDYVEAYPNAKPIGVERFGEQKPNIKWAGLFGAGGELLQYGFEPHISLHQVKAHMNHELVAIHHPSGTLINADMLFNLPPTEQYSRAGGISILTRLLGGGSSMSPGGTVHGLTSGVIAKDKELLKKELAPIQAAKWDRIIPCHGDVIETGGRAAWDKVWAKYS